MNNYKVYSLVCPNSGIVRYIGVTKQNLSDRFSSHLRDGNNPYKANWIEKLKRSNQKPVIKLLAEGLSAEEAFAKEVRLIEFFRSVFGKKLTNIADGGPLPPPSKTVAVQQLTLEGEVVCEFPGIREAAQKTQIDNSTIVKALKGKRKTVGGYIWKYKE